MALNATKILLVTISIIKFTLFVYFICKRAKILYIVDFTAFKCYNNHSQKVCVEHFELLLHISFFV